MKYSTKYKILKFVKKIIKWEDPVYLELNEQERKIITVQSIKLIQTEELQRLSPSEIEQILIQDLLSELFKIQAISISKDDFSFTSTDPHPLTKLTGSLKFVMP